MDFWVVRKCGGPKNLILSDEQVDALTEGLTMLRDAMCSGETSVGVRGCERGVFWLNVTRSLPTARLYAESQYISVTLTGIDYLSLMFSVVKNQLRD